MRRLEIQAAMCGSVHGIWYCVFDWSGRYEVEMALVRTSLGLRSFRLHLELIILASFC